MTGPTFHESVTNIRSVNHPCHRRLPLFDWSHDERRGRDGYHVALTAFEWTLLLKTLEHSPYAAVQQLADDVTRQIKEQKL